MKYVRLLLAAALLALALALGAAAGPAAADSTDPTVAVSPKKAGAGHDITVTGQGWKPGTLLTLLICGQNAIGGTNSCANAGGRAATTDAHGAFSRQMPVTEPPKPCPCVVHVATVMGDPVVVDAPFVVAGHPVAPLPTRTTGGRLAVLSARLEGSSGLLTWFGAPPQRTLVITVGNLGSDPAKDPVFQVGTSHGVYAPCGRTSPGTAPYSPARSSRSESRWSWRRARTATTPCRCGTAARFWPPTPGPWAALGA